jgi:hypothetical protein
MLDRLNLNFKYLKNYNILSKKINFKIFKKRSVGRFYNGKIVNFSIGKSYNKFFFIKSKFITNILFSPVSIRSTFSRKFKININKLILGGCIDINVPILEKKPIGFLFYKDNNNNFINTLFYFSYGSKVS